MFVAELKNYWKKKGVQIDNEEDSRVRALTTSAQKKILGRTIMKARLDLLSLLQLQNQDGSFYPLSSECSPSDFEALLFPSSSSLSISTILESLHIGDLSSPACLSSFAFSRSSFLVQFLSLSYYAIPPTLQERLNAIPSASAVRFLITLVTSGICQSLYTGLRKITGKSQTVIKQYMGSSTTTNVESIYDSSNSITIDKLLQRRSLTNWLDSASQFLSSFLLPRGQSSSNTPSSASSSSPNAGIDSLSLSEEDLSTLSNQIQEQINSLSSSHTKGSDSHSPQEKFLSSLFLLVESVLQRLYASQSNESKPSQTKSQSSNKTQVANSPSGSKNNSPNSQPKTAPMRRMFFALQKEWDPQFRTAAPILATEGAEYPINVHYIFKIPSVEGKEFEDPTVDKVDDADSEANAVIVKARPQRLLGGEFQYCGKSQDCTENQNQNQKSDDECRLSHSLSLVSKLGSGTFASVYDAVWKIHSPSEQNSTDPLELWKIDYLAYQLSNKVYSVNKEDETDNKQEIECAAKVYSSHISGDDQMVFLNELHILSRLSHPHVINVLAANIQPPNYCMVMRKCPHGTLYDLIKSGSQDRIAWWPDRVLTVGYDISLALQYLHSEGIVHRDIKSLNVLLREDNRAVLCDFGVGTFLKANEKLSTNIKVGSPYYMAPEIIRRHPYSHQADIFSFGVMMWEALVRQEPYQDLSAELPAVNGWETIVNRVASEQLRPASQFARTRIHFMYGLPILAKTLLPSPLESVLPSLASLSEEHPAEWMKSDETRPLRQLIEQMWSDSPSDRPDASSLVNTFGYLAPLNNVSLPDLRIRPPPPSFSDTPSTSDAQTTSTKSDNKQPQAATQKNEDEQKKPEDQKRGGEKSEFTLFKEWKMHHFWEFISESRASRHGKKINLDRFRLFVDRSSGSYVNK